MRPLAVGPAAARLGTTPRMLRYRERLGLLPAAHGGAGSHRRYGEQALRATALAVELERRYDVSPATLAFGLRVLADPALQAEVRRLGQLTGALVPANLAALDFETEKGRRLLPPGR